MQLHRRLIDGVVLGSNEFGAMPPARRSDPVPHRRRLDQLPLDELVQCRLHRWRIDVQTAGDAAQLDTRPLIATNRRTVSSSVIPSPLLGR